MCGQYRHLRIQVGCSVWGQWKRQSFSHQPLAPLSVTVNAHCRLKTVYCTIFKVHRTLYTEFCKLNNSYRALHLVQCLLNKENCTSYQGLEHTVLTTALHCTLLYLCTQMSAKQTSVVSQPNMYEVEIKKKKKTVFL